jgi:antitoxin PrlF
MAKKKGPLTDVLNCIPMGCCNCKIDAMLSVDERGQMVLPKDLRDKAGIKAGDKLAAISWEQEGQTACIVLIKSDNLAGMVKGFLGPVFKDLFKK